MYIIGFNVNHAGIVPPKVSGEDSHTILVDRGRGPKNREGERLKARRYGNCFFVRFVCSSDSQSYKH